MKSKNPYQIFYKKSLQKKFSTYNKDCTQGLGEAQKAEFEKFFGIKC